MNQNAVKELTRKGCIVEKDAAEHLTEEDVERILGMDTTPMYLSQPMLEKLRGNNNGQEVDTESNTRREDEGSDGTKAESEQEAEREAQEEYDSGENGEQDATESRGQKFSESKTVTIRDSRRDTVSTKVEILDEAEITKDEKDVPEFLACYNDRYEKQRKMLTRRMEMKSAVSIKRLERREKGEEVSVIGLVNEKYSTNSGKYILELEDKTGSFKALVDERQGDRIVPDELIGVSGSMGGDIVYGDTVVRPDLPIPDGTSSTEQSVKAAYISDLHLGSEDTLYDRFDRFAKWLNSDGASGIGYLVIAGDIVEGVGVYPDQEEELRVTDIYRQYEMFEEWVKKLPEDLQIIVSPGNHDVVRLAEPQPRIPEKALSDVASFDNIHLVQNPQYVRLHGVESSGVDHLLYHGMSFDEHVDQIKELRESAYDEPRHVMIDLLKRRHLAPTYGSNLMAPEGEDHLVIDREPDVMVSGHFHSHDIGNYKGVTTVCSSTFQTQTDFQRKVGHVPDPGKVTVHDLKKRNTEVKQF